jgi:hypothetical protein
MNMLEVYEAPQVALVQLIVISISVRTEFAIIGETKDAAAPTNKLRPSEDIAID